MSAAEIQAFTVTYVTCNSAQMGLSVPVDLSENTIGTLILRLAAPTALTAFLFPSLCCYIV